MKRHTVLSILILLSMVLVALPAPLAAQEGTTVEQPRAPRPADDVAAVPAAARPDWSGSWQYGPDTTFVFTRFDGGYYPDDNKVYFMGGRLGDGNTDGSVWSFDPVAGTYADMGVDLVTPISNYTMHLLQDAAGAWAFYTLCGRPAAGGTTAAVQAYYPDTNTAVQLDPADDYPGAVSCTSGLQVVYNNKVYVAGGFDGTANHAETWVFDPTAAVGSKWTQVASANLTQGRAYLMGAVVDDLIYAIGGAWFDGSALVNVTMVEVMDPNAATPVWDDAAVADLPEECSSSRAWGFDTGAPYNDPDGTPLGGKIVSGCGVWSDENEHVYVYDTALNFWDSFPWFNVDRRDQAGEFIPSMGAGRDDGVPAMWVWGGRKDLDTNVLVSSEYYDVPPFECSILLVDDDWDFDQVVPNDGGRPYYTSTLEYLGMSYDLWDTVSMGTPTAGDLDPYSVVVWFTGYDWQTPISPTEEVELSAYLDNGGNLLMSSQEQEYAFPGSAIMSDYFWVDTVVEDVTLTGTVGGPSDPLFSGLGPYTMDRPDAWAAYWPTAEYQGPYDDEAYVKPGGFEPTLYTDNNNPNATRFQGASFKTIYLGYPFEWIVDLDDRAEFMSTALGWLCAVGDQEFGLIPPGQTGGGIPGAVVPYTLTIVNELGYAETFDLTYDGIWTPVGPATVGPVADGATEDFVVEVTIPGDANCLDRDLGSILAQAQSTPAISATAYVDTEALPAGEGNVAGYIYDANTGDPLENADILLELKNETIAHTAYTDADGYFSMERIEACTFNGSFRAYGYDPLYIPVAVTDQATTTVDIDLDAAWPEWAPSSVAKTLPLDNTGSATLNLANLGTGELHFHVTEVPSDSGYPVPMSAPSLPGGVDAQVYADLAASKDGTARFIVYMADQADLSAAFQIEDWSVRGQYVLNALRATARRSQAGLRADLDAAGVAYDPRYIVNALVVEGDRNLVDSLAARPDVASIGPDLEVPAPEPVDMGPAVEGADAPVWNVAQINADDVWTTFGVTGTGVVVSNIDTGVMYTHTALVDGYRGNTGGGTFDHNYNWWDPYGDQPNAPYDYHSHGSHTIGTMVGRDYMGQEIGIAPGGQWIACNGFDEGGSGFEAELLECAEFLLAPWDLTGANPDPDARPHVVNNSWGGGPAATWWYNQVVYAWRAAGIFPVFSAGNAGSSCDTAGYPGAMENVMAVGATNNADVIASFSSRGPADISGIMKPQVSAPGVSVISAYNTGAVGPMSGTSMAAPHVGGEAALLWSAVPELVGDVQLTYWIIEQTALGITTNDGCGGDGPTDIPNNTYGWGRIDAYEAVDLALDTNWDISWLDVDPAMGVVAPGRDLDIELMFDTTGLTDGMCYTGTLKIEFNDPYVVETFLPVELCVGAYQYYLPIVVKNYD